MASRRRVNIVLGVGLLALGALVAPAILFAAGTQPQKTDGRYRVTVAGHYEGSGLAEVRNRRVIIRATIRADGSPDGPLICHNLHLDGDHFNGTGTYRGIQFKIRGRLDGYAGDKEFRGARILCTYIDQNGDGGRIVGVLD